MTNRNNLLLPALLAAGTALGAGPAAALELGDLRVESRLGQPLRASIAYALAPDEGLAAYCISVLPEQLPAGRVLGETRIHLKNGRIQVTGMQAVREPIASLRIALDCPYAARLRRDYTVFLDPALPAAAAEPATASAAARPALAARPADSTADPAAIAPARAGGAAVPAAGQYASHYQVRRGDTLSAIAGRLPGRRVALWDAVDALYAANPHAFLGADANRLIAGAWLVVPPGISAPGAEVADPAVTTSAAARREAAAAAPATPSLVPAPVATAAGTPVAEPPVQDVAALQPGQVLIAATPTPGAGAAAAVPPPVEIVIAPAAGDAAHDLAPPRRDAGGSLGRLLTAGFTLLAALVLVALRARRRNALAPVGAPAGRDATGTVPTLDLIVADDYELDDDSPTTENLVLDADFSTGNGLGEGGGLGDAGDIFVAEDFGFDTNSDIDFELPEAAAADDPEPETDVIPPPRIEASAILESEVLPEDDYDMSIITDVTKVPDPEAVAERDLKAVVVSAADDTRVDDVYTVSQEVDYQVLEQDYEDELSATAALNLEIEKAAAELAKNLDLEIPAEGGTAEPRRRPPRATVSPFSTLAAAVNDDDAGGLEVTTRLGAMRPAGEPAGDGTDSDADTDVMIAGTDLD